MNLKFHKCKVSLTAKLHEMHESMYLHISLSGEIPNLGALSTPQ